MIEGDLTFPMAMLNWGARSRDERGRLFLDRNPLKGLDDREYRALLRVLPQGGWRFHARNALVRAHESGAICKLRRHDIDLEDRTIRWRAEHE